MTSAAQKRADAGAIYDAKIEALRLCPLTRDERGFLEDLYAAETVDEREEAALERIARKYGL